MNQTSLPPAVEDLRLRTRDFIRSVVIPAEPRPGERLDDGLRRELGDAAKDAGVFAPHVPVPSAARACRSTTGPRSSRRPATRRSGRPC